MRIAILQSNYLPWKGVFDMIYQVDQFVFLEDVQYTEHDWRNRNRIKTCDGVKWLVVPVKHSGRRGQLICEAEIDTRVNWQRKHYNAFQLNYAKAPCFKQYKWILEVLYADKKWEMLSDFNINASKVIAQVLGIHTKFVHSCELNAKGQKDDKVLDICRKLSATHYLSGPAAQNYISSEKFEKNGVGLSYISYEYPPYPQLHGEFTHHVTVLDLIFNCGNNSPYFIWGWRENEYQKHE